MTFAAFYRKMQFCYCPGVGHLHTFLKSHHDEVFVSKRKPNVLSSLLRIRKGMNGLIENISSINPFFARPSGAFNTPDNVDKGRVFHFKHKTFSALSYTRNCGATVKERTTK